LGFFRSHFGSLAVNLATIGLIFFVARELFDSMTRAAAAVSLSILSAGSSVLGMAAHATHFVALIVSCCEEIMSCCVVARGGDLHSTRRLRSSNGRANSGQVNEHGVDRNSGYCTLNAVDLTDNK
jgi:hypothetical protein